MSPYVPVACAESSHHAPIAVCSDSESVMGVRRSRLERLVTKKLRLKLGAGAAIAANFFSLFFSRLSSMEAMRLECSR